jgi:hypothetical protein
MTAGSPLQPAPEQAPTSRATAAERATTTIPISLGAYHARSLHFLSQPASLRGCSSCVAKSAPGCSPVTTYVYPRPDGAGGGCARTARNVGTSDIQPPRRDQTVPGGLLTVQLTTNVLVWQQPRLRFHERIGQQLVEAAPLSRR